MNLAINWNVSPELIPGWKTPNLYGILFISGIILGYFVIRRMFRRENIEEALLDKLLWYMLIATVVGARLGHCLFYGPWWDGINPETGVFEEGYLSHPLNILKVYEGGLASHGAAIVILFTLYYFSKKISQRPMLWLLDRVSAPIAIAGCFIRLGNLVNHEMIGRETDLPWGFRFMRADCPDGNCAWESLPIRHPGQLYEAMLYLVAFGILMWMYWKRDAWKRQGLVFGSFLVLIFGARFLVEFVKVEQVAHEKEWLLNTGQLLSIPLVIAGIFLIYRSFKVPQQENGVELEEERK